MYRLVQGGSRPRATVQTRPYPNGRRTVLPKLGAMRTLRAGRLPTSSLVPPYPRRPGRLWGWAVQGSWGQACLG